MPASPRGEALFRCARPSGVPRGPATSTGSLASQIFIPLCSSPGENARSWEALGEASQGQSSLSAGRGPDPTSKATLWVKAQHEGALPPPCIVRKDPRVAGPLGTPLGLAQRKRASPRGEAGTSGFLCVSDADRRVPAELGQESQASSCLRKGPVHRPQRPAGSTHSSTRGLRPPEQLERPPKLHLCAQTLHAHCFLYTNI